MGKIKFILSWTSANLFGWLFGIITGFCIGEIFLAQILSKTFHHSAVDFLSNLFVWLPHGVFIGIAQSLIIRKYKLEIQSNLWIIATTFGWGISITILSWYLNNMGFREIHLFLLPFIIILSGAIIGWSQALVMGTNFPKHTKWVFANIAGIVLCIFVFGYIVVFAKNVFLPKEGNFGGEETGVFEMLIMVLVFPLMGAIPSIPTGIYLSNCLPKFSEIDENKITTK